ncbi:MAG TPA: NAD(P)/FAD-dependent oxidoreductase [Solirubrobacterales bacterium]|nr:NAD(P)/FAD-dependent oxidoreductase [Solirubrobacterales bacterium]
MADATTTTNGTGAAPAQPEHVDVLIVGAGLSGIGAACHLTMECPDRSFAVLEAREASGGTWDLFRYPGIRSDSDMFTLGYSFRPWKEAEAIADGEQIRSYIRETATEYGIDDRIRYGHRVVGAEWSSETARWTVTVERTDTGEETELTCSFLFGCTGYYSYESGYTPELPGIDRFQGTVVHPQEWPEDLDYAGKRVVVIGSGATAVTLIPAMAEKTESLVMLQRSPSYLLSLPARDPLAALLQRLLPERAAYAIMRWKNVLVSQAFFQLSRRRPELVRRLIRRGVTKQLPAGYDVDRHFNPSYDPWDQRVCLDPDGNLFEAMRHGRAEIVTDEIETFTETGIELRSGGELTADIVVTATGLNLRTAGDLQPVVDGERIDLSETVGYKGMMLSGIPNFAMSLGYTNASWTLKSDLVAHYVCRLLNHMRDNRYGIAMPRRPDSSVGTEPFIDLKAGYVLRSIDKLPRQGSREPWRLHQNYPRDVALLKRGPLEDEGIEFQPAAAPAHRAMVTSES